MSKRNRDRSTLFANQSADEVNSIFAADKAIYGDIAGVDEGRQLAVITKENTVEIGAFLLTTVGLQIQAQATFDEWQKVGQLLQRLDFSIQWLIGDWMAYGEHTWGQTYEQVAEVTGYSYQTLRNATWVARNVVLSLRKDKLSFGHHALVASLEPPDQAHWLGLAETQSWSISQMRKALAGTPTPPLPDVVDQFAEIFAQDRRKFEKLVKKLDRVGGGERRQISQLLEEHRRWLDEVEQKIRQVLE